jgi:hypothetical protein
MNRRSLAGVTVFLLVASLAPAADGVSRPDAETLTAWTARQSRVRSARFVIDETTTVSKGARTPPRAQEKGVVIPPADHSYNSPKVVAFEGEKLRYQYTEQQWNEKKQSYFPDEYVCTFNGTDCRSLHSPGRVEFWQGVLRKEDHHRDIGNYHLYPVLFTYRANVPQMSAIAGQQLSNSKEVRMDEHNCIEFQVGAAGAVTTTIVVDPSKEYSIVRYVVVTGDKIRLKMDIEYRLVPMLGWVPASWETIVKPDEAPQFYNAVVKEYSINQPLGEDYFEIAFPPGTWVQDDKSVPPKQYLVKPDGAIRPVPPQDAVAPYRRILQSEPGHAAEEKWRFESLQDWRFVAIGIGGLILGGLLLKPRILKRFRPTK